MSSLMGCKYCREKHKEIGVLQQQLGQCQSRIFDYKARVAALQTRISELENPWIDCNERLPEIGEYVLAGSGDSSFVACLTESLEHTYGGVRWWRKPGVAGAWNPAIYNKWMPIPKRGDGMNDTLVAN